MLGKWQERESGESQGQQLLIKNQHLVSGLELKHSPGETRADKGDGVTQIAAPGIGEGLNVSSQLG